MVKIIIYILKPWINQIFRKRFETKFGYEVQESLVKNAWKEFSILLKMIEPQTNVGARIMVALAVCTDSFYMHLEKSIGQEQTVRLIGEVAWSIYRKMGRFTFFLTGFYSKDKYKRLLLATRFFRFFPFSSPSYKWHENKTERNMVSFNCERCPVAEYFISQGKAHLGYNTWCQLDYSLAKLWSGQLELTNTKAGGAELCDFRFVISNSQQNVDDGIL